MREPDPDLPVPSPTPEPNIFDDFVEQLRSGTALPVEPAPTPSPAPAVAPTPRPQPGPATPTTSPANAFDDILAKAKSFAPASEVNKGENIRWIAQRAAFGTLRLCLLAASDPKGGLSFGAADIHAIDPGLSRVYESAKVIGDVLGDLGQRGKDGRVHEPGMNLPPLKPGKGARQFSPTIEAANQAIKKLRQNYYNDADIAAELGLDVAVMRSKLDALWHHDRYAAAYPRGRRSAS